MTRITLPHFVVQPSGIDHAAGLVVLHDSFGIGGSLLRVSQRLANEGYFVVTPDLYFRVGGTKSAPWPELRESLDHDQVIADLGSSAHLLRGMGATNIGVVGFCLGGSLAYRMAVETDLVDAAVGFYGSSLIDNLDSPQCPLQLFYGSQDPWIGADQISTVVAHHPETVVYPEAGHGFMRDGSEEYVATAADDAWARTTAFLGRHLLTTNEEKT